MAGFLKPGARQLADVQKRLDELSSKREKSLSILAAADDERDAVAAGEHSGEITPEKASTRFAEIADQVRRHRDEVDRLGRLIQLSHNEIAEIEQRAADDAYQTAVAAFRSEQTACRAKEEEFVKALRGILGRLSGRERAQAALAAAHAHAVELQPEGAEAPDHVDETDWPAGAELERLAAAIVAGPRQPVQSGAARREQAARDRARDDEHQIAAAAREILAEEMPELRKFVLARLPERLRGETRSRVEAELGKHRANAPESASTTQSRASSYVRIT